ncbi:hypothetical protein, partial [Hydrogenophaga sp. OTU3427]|uniref:hypothetical protein n=1 Tax=Hydrogenophaga sp. OTU3427 TaxID=3043856 RepID=UPI00313F0338
MASIPISDLSSASAIALLAATVSLNAQAQSQAAVPECVQDTHITERYIPVELLTGNPIPEKQELSFAPVKRIYPFIDASPDRTGDIKETSLDGPMSWMGQGGKVYEVYERKVPRAHERFALTPDGT